MTERGDDDQPPRPLVWAQMTEAQRFIWTIVYRAAVEVSDSELDLRAERAADACVRMLDENPELAAHAQAWTPPLPKRKRRKRG